jgi:hypothetical protein
MTLHRSGQVAERSSSCEGADAGEALASLKRPCASCPWLRGAKAASIPNFDLGLARALAKTCPDDRGMGPEFGASWFACHQSRPGQKMPCAGWLAAAGRAHPGVRMACFSGRLDPELLAPGAGWPELYSSFAEMLANLEDGMSSGGAQS